MKKVVEERDQQIDHLNILLSRREGHEGDEQQEDGNEQQDEQEEEEAEEPSCVNQQLNERENVNQNIVNYSKRLLKRVC